MIPSKKLAHLIICLAAVCARVQVRALLENSGGNTRGLSGGNEGNKSGIDTSAYAKSHPCVWKPCTAIGFAAEYNSYTVDCCTLQLPLDYSQQGSDRNPLKTISVSMTRLSPPKSSENTLFVLAGGPGNAGWNLVDKLPYLLQPHFGITLVIPDHRGTGLSTYLACDDRGSQEITPACVPYLISKFGVEGIKQFSMTNAARDLAVQIQAYKLQFPGRIGIMGASYGTQLLNRFLTIYPTLVDSAVMDGVAHPLLTSLSRAEVWASVVSEQFLTYCQVLPECSRYFQKESPQDALRNILRQLDAHNQKCIHDHFHKYQITSVKMRTLLNDMFGDSEKYWDRTVIPAIIFRLGRCNSHDVTALEFFFKKSFDAPTPNADPNGEGFLISSTLRFNVVQSEGWLAKDEAEVDLETINAWYSSTLLAPNVNGLYMKMRPLWPKYELDEYATQIANYSPLMMITGLLDPATFFHVNAQLATLTTATRTFHPVPLSGHITANLAAVNITCPFQLIQSFLFPSIFGPTDPTCLQKMPTTIDFVGSTPEGQQASMTYLNVRRPFEN